MLSRTFTVDFSFGKTAEIKFLQTFRDYFNDQSINLTNDFDVFDYEGTNIFIELKTRNNTKNKYNDTMIGLNKIKKAKNLIKSNNNIKIYFVFKFTDGLYYWNYDNTIELKIDKGGRTDRYKIEIKDYCYIPVNQLSEIIL